MSNLPDPTDRAALDAWAAEELARTLRLCPQWRGDRGPSERYRAPR